MEIVDHFVPMVSCCAIVQNTRDFTACSDKYSFYSTKLHIKPIVKKLHILVMDTMILFKIKIQNITT